MNELEGMASRLTGQMGSSIDLTVNTNSSDLETEIQRLETTLLTLPPTHPGCAKILNNLGVLLFKRFLRTGSLLDLNESIGLYQDACEPRLRRSVDDHTYAGFLKNLVLGLLMRFQVSLSGNSEDLDAVVAIYRDALRPGIPKYHDHTTSLDDLMLSLKNRQLARPRRSADPMVSITPNRDSVILRFEGPRSERSERISKLVEALRSRRTVLMRDAEHSPFTFDQDASSTRFKPERNRYKSLDDLVVILKDPLTSGNILDELDNSLSPDRGTFHLWRPKENPEHARHLSSLAASLQARFTQMGDIKDLDESTVLYRKALRLCPPSHPKRAKYLKKLAETLQAHFAQTMNLKNIDESVFLLRNALELLPGKDRERTEIIDDLANGLQIRFRQVGNRDDLEESITLVRSAISGFHKTVKASRKRFELDDPILGFDSGFRVVFQRTGEARLGDREAMLIQDALISHHEFMRDVLSRPHTSSQQAEETENLNGTIEPTRDVLLLRPKEWHPDLPSLQKGLARGLHTRFQATQKDHIGSKDLEESIILNRDALEHLPEEHPDRAECLQNLAANLRDHYNLSGNPKELDESIMFERQALELCPEGHADRARSLSNLAFGLRTRFDSDQTRNRDDLKASLMAYADATDDPFSPLTVRLEAAKAHAELARDHDPQRSLEAYLSSLSIVPQLLSLIPTVSLQYSRLSSLADYSTLASATASLAIQLEQPALAVEVIEQGRGLLWSELRGLRAPMEQLRAIDPTLADRFSRVNRRLETLAKNSFHPSDSLVRQSAMYPIHTGGARSSFGHILAQKRRLLAERQEILDKIRQLPGFETFLDRSPFAMLQSAASCGPVIMINCSNYRSDALIIYKYGPPRHVPLPQSLYDIARTLSRQLTEARKKIKLEPKNYNHILRDVLQVLWDLVVSHVVTQLREMGIPEMSRIFWCPTSVLSTLPLHAAGPTLPRTKTFLPDLYISSYTPTLTALIDALNAPSPPAMMKAPRLLVVGQHDSSLPRAKDEIMEVVRLKRHISVTCVDGQMATHVHVIKLISNHEWLHITCHGTLVPTNPFSSYFGLAEGKQLTLLDVIRLRLKNASFAFLSACHTAGYSPDSIHDEVIHLAAAMQFCGFRSIVGTMWEMADDDGPELVKNFYSHLFSDEDTSSSWNKAGAHAQALARAIKTMRQRKGVPFESWVNFVHIGA